MGHLTWIRATLFWQLIAINLQAVLPMNEIDSHGPLFSRRQYNPVPGRLRNRLSALQSTSYTDILDSFRGCSRSIKMNEPKMETVVSVRTLAKIEAS